jgi:hypothetical protein
MTEPPISESPVPEPGEPSGLVDRAKALRDAPTWLALAPLGILGATVLATALDGVVLTLIVLFVGAAVWGTLVWRVIR